jgi:hypothetical protein
MEDPASSYATAGTALWVFRAQKPHYIKLGTNRKKIKGKYPDTSNIITDD